MSKTSAAVKAKPETAPELDPGSEAVKRAMSEVRPPIAALLAGEIWAREAGVKFNTWEAVPPAGTPFENVLRPDFWANVSKRMKMGDKIIVLPRDGAWYGELVVWDAGQNWANVSGAHQVKPAFEHGAPGLESDFEIVSDPIDGICVKRRSTGQKIKSNFPNSEDARRWMLEHQRVLRT